MNPDTPGQPASWPSGRPEDKSATTGGSRSLKPADPLPVQRDIYSVPDYHKKPIPPRPLKRRRRRQRE